MLILTASDRCKQLYSNCHCRIIYPGMPHSTFDNELAAGNWALTISDLALHDTGQINEWCIAVELFDPPVLPPAPPYYNPDLGFVGSVYGAWGQFPPNAYGVHAKPIADRLRDFGTPVIAHHLLS